MKYKEDIQWQILANTVLGIVALSAIIPIALLFIASFTDEQWALANGYSFFPGKLSLEAYIYILKNASLIVRGYVNTIIVTIAGTLLSIVLTSLLAYALVQDELPGVRVLNFLVIFTMLFSGGVVSSYYVWTNIFKVRDTYLGLILPGLLMNAFNIILVKNYYRSSIPGSLLEAARIDGASTFGVFLRIVMPLSRPIIATIGLMTGLAYWNDWTNGLYYLSARKGVDYYTIQLILNKINDSMAFLQSSSSIQNANINVPSATARMAIAAVGILPVLIIYPFLQKHFVKGITIGAVKE